MGQGFHIAVSCGVGRRRGSDPQLLWLWCRLAATVPIQPLVWELPHAMGTALKRKNKKQKNKTKKKVDGGDGYPTVKFTKIIELYT